MRTDVPSTQPSSQGIERYNHPNEITSYIWYIDDNCILTDHFLGSIFIKVLLLSEYYSWLFPRFTPDGTALQSVYEAFRFTESYGVSLDNCHFCDWLCDNGDPLGDLPVQCEVLPWSLWTGNFHSVFIYIIYIYLLGIVHLSFLLGKGYV